MTLFFTDLIDFCCRSFFKVFGCFLMFFWLYFVVFGCLLFGCFLFLVVFCGSDFLIKNQKSSRVLVVFFGYLLLFMLSTARHCLRHCGGTTVLYPSILITVYYSPLCTLHYYTRLHVLWLILTLLIGHC